MIRRCRLQDALCVRAVIGRSPGGFPGPATSPGLPCTAPSQRKPAAGSIFFIPSPRTKFGACVATPERMAAAPPTADGPTHALAAATDCMHCDTMASDWPSVGPCSITSTGGLDGTLERAESRRRLELGGFSTLSADGGSFFARADNSRCPFAAFGGFGVPGGRREVDAAPPAVRQADVFRPPTATVMVRIDHAPHACAFRGIADAAMWCVSLGACWSARRVCPRAQQCDGCQMMYMRTEPRTAIHCCTTGHCGLPMRLWAAHGCLYLVLHPLLRWNVSLWRRPVFFSHV